jgi:NMD protein affecting ribosome stability and mRNA decay
MSEATFACPRCGHEVSERFWGPCTACRVELVSLIRAQPEEVETARFEPAMNVVPNHVATKD